MALAALGWTISTASWGYNMSTPAQTIAGILERGHEKRQNEKSQEKHDEREAKLQTLVSSGLPPQQVQQGIRDIYGQDAPALKQHVENLFKRVAGKQPQGPAPSRSQDLQGLLAQGKTQQQQQLGAYKDQLQAQQDAQFSGNQRLMQYIQSLPPEQQAQAMQLYGVSARPQYKLYTLPDGSTQYFDPSSAPAGATAVEPGTSRVVTMQGPNGSTYGTEKGGKFYDASGNVISDAHPAPKTPTGFKAGTSNGRNVYASPSADGKGWVDATGAPVPNFQPMPTYAQIAPSLRPVQVVNPNDPSSTMYESSQEAIKSHAQGTQSVDYKMQMPTAQERGRADLAMSAQEQMQTMTSILQNRQDLFGPVAGRGTNFSQWIGSQDPDAQRFAAAARIAADHLAGVFGGRSQAALEAIYKTIGDNKTNPQAAIAAIQQMSQAAARIQSRGVGPAPGGGAKGGAQTHKVGDTITQNGHKFKVTAVDANGKVTGANPQ